MQKSELSLGEQFLWVGGFVWSVFLGIDDLSGIKSSWVLAVDTKQDGHSFPTFRRGPVYFLTGKEGVE